MGQLTAPNPEILHRLTRKTHHRSLEHPPQKALSPGRYGTAVVGNAEAYLTIIDQFGLKIRI